MTNSANEALAEAFKPHFTKRSIDVAGASLLGVVSKAVGVKYAERIEADGVGPALITVPRLGFGLNYFRMSKWRTMNEIDDAQNPVNDSNDPRITELGGFLRRASLDETAQYRNIFDGEMHLLGVRPLAKSTVDLFEERGTPDVYSRWLEARAVHAPGAFGFNASGGREPDQQPSTESIDSYMLLDIQQLEGESLAQDLRLLMGLAQTVLRMRNH